ncbi:thiamine phosphate synthase [Pseudalkalibacillus sp. SCS-8]|uniref:thiamine phosphate synthase n=1 Tax=Pseudalkalibacillus nanhaiensis TaxID=3115291 RepID=UPI0032DB6799
MKNVKKAMKLYLVMGSLNCERDPREVLKEAIEGGVTLFQFREKGSGCLSGAAKRELALDLKAICHASGIPFIVNDDVALALELDADGVHIGQEDGSIEEIRHRVGDKILGVSTHDVVEAEAAVRAGADYIGVGPMFMTKTKTDIQEVRGPIVIEEICRGGLEVPLVGIGGINTSNVEQVMEAGADGVAVISAISQADNPRERAQQFFNIVKRSKQMYPSHKINHS